MTHTQLYTESLFIEYNDVNQLPWDVCSQIDQRYLGQGGYGFVFTAFHSKKKKHVALKRIQIQAELPEKVQEKQILAAKQEVNFCLYCKKNKIPNVIKVSKQVCLYYDKKIFQQYNIKQYYFVKCFEIGISLQDILVQHIKQQLLWSESEIIWIIFPLLQALIKIHQLGFSHQDIKPENIMYSINDKVWKLSDFGSVQQLKGGFDQQNQYQIRGTFNYWTPNLKYKSNNNNDQAIYYPPASDLYALGITLYQMLFLLDNSVIKNDFFQQHYTLNEKLLTHQLAKILISDNEKDRLIQQDSMLYQQLEKEFSISKMSQNDKVFVELMESKRNYNNYLEMANLNRQFGKKQTSYYNFDKALATAKDQITLTSEIKEESIQLTLYIYNLNFQLYEIYDQYSQTCFDFGDYQKSEDIQLEEEKILDLLITNLENEKLIIQQQTMENEETKIHNCFLYFIISKATTLRFNGKQLKSIKMLNEFINSDKNIQNLNCVLHFELYKVFAECLLSQQMISEADKYAKKAEQLYQKHNFYKDGDLNLSQLYKLLGNIKSELGYPKDSEDFYIKAINSLKASLEEQQIDNYEIARIKINLGEQMKRQGNIKEGLNIQIKAQQIIEKQLENQGLVAQNYALIANGYFLLQNFEECFNYCKKCFDIQQQKNLDKIHQFYIYPYLIHSFYLIYHLNQYQEALDQIELALVPIKEVFNYNNKYCGKLLICKAICLKKLGQLDQAELIAKESLNQFLKYYQFKECSKVGESYWQLGSICIKILEQFKNRENNELVYDQYMKYASEYLNKSLEIYQNTHIFNSIYIAHVKVKIGQLKWLEGDLEAAIEFLKSALSIKSQVYENQNHPDCIKTQTKIEAIFQQLSACSQTTSSTNN